MPKRIQQDRTALFLLFLGLAGVALFIPWRAHYTNICIVVSGSLWLLFIKQNRRYFSRPVILFILLLISVYLVELIGITYTENLDYGFHRLESKLAMVIMPVVILASGIDRRHIERLLAVFVLSTLIACLYCTAVAVFDIIEKEKPLTAFFLEGRYANVALTEPLRKMHPTFLTLFICLSIFSIVVYMRQLKGHYWMSIIILFLLIFSFQLASRAGYVALLCTMFLIGFSLIGLNRRLWLWVYSIVIVATFILSISFIPQLRQRLVDAVLEADITTEQVNSVSYHLKSWTCSVESWLDGHILFGYGTGDEVDTISKCYEEKNWVGHRHDAHNEFLSSLVKHGLFGFFVLCVMFFYPFYLSLKYRELRYFTFLTIIFVCFLSESMLRGQSGLLFFTFFNALFMKDMLLRINKIPETLSIQP